MAKKKKPDVVVDEIGPKNGYEKTKQLIHQTQATGMFVPLMQILDTLSDDPLLKQMLQAAPASYYQSNKIN